MTLLIATAVLPVVGTMNNKKINLMTSLNTESVSIDTVWSDNFDSYDLGQILDGTSDDGGWKLYDDGHSSPMGAYIVDDQFLSSPYSVEIFGQEDIIHEFTGLNSGNWTLTDWVYVPDDYRGGSCLFLGSYYEPGVIPMRCWHVGVSFDGDSDVVYDFYGGVEELPLITDQWVELRVELNFEEDWCECYYNDELLMEGVWTDMGYGNGYYNLAGLDFCWGDSPIYHDNLFIEGETNGLESNLESYGDLNWIDVPAESIVTGNFTLENIGDPGSRLEWIIYEYPDFGDWTCEPNDGSLKPEDGPITVQVTVEAPDKKNKEFNGELKLHVIGNPSDSCTIDVSLATPKNKVVNTPFMQFLENHPHLFPLLRQILELK